MFKISSNQLLFLYLILVIFSWTKQISCFQNRYVNFKRMTPLVTSKTRPLSTASSKNFLGNIPRLEIGLRFLKTQLNIPKSYADIKFANPMDWLSEQESQKSNSLFALPGKLFTESLNKLSFITRSFLKYMKTLTTSLAILSSSIGLPNMKNMAIFGVTASSIVSCLPPIANAGVFGISKYTNLSPTQKLATTPLYFISNSDGNPYLQEDLQAGKPEQKIVVYFMSSEDANEYLNEMSQSNPQNINEFRIVATSMEKVVNKIQSRKQSRKLGRYPMSLIYRIQVGRPMFSYMTD
jgi:hypothetical protein